MSSTARVAGAIFLACVGCGPARSAKATTGMVVAASVRCRALDSVVSELNRGRLRHAAASLEERAPFCDELGAKAMRARLALDLAQYERAAVLVGELEHAAASSASALRGELTRRTTPASFDAQARAKTLSARAFDEPDKDTAHTLFLQAWQEAPPNGLALIFAGERLAQEPLADAQSGGAKLAEVRRLFERGVAELERETGEHAHAGIRAHLICRGLFSNGLTVEWLPDSRHVVVRCGDGSAIFDALSNERVANADRERLDESWLPLLRFRPKAAERAGDREVPNDLDSSAVGCTSDGHDWTAQTRLIHLDKDRGELTVSSERRGAVHHPLRALFATVAHEAGATGVPDWSLVCDAKTSSVEISAVWYSGGRTQRGLGLINLSTGEILGPVSGRSVHLLDDGRVAVRGEQGVTIIDRHSGEQTRLKGQGADLSFDGRRLVVVKPQAVAEDYRPVWPYLLDRGSEEPLGDFSDTTQIAPASFSWPRVGPLEPSDCAPENTMSGGGRRCAHPGITLAGVSYDSHDEVACSEVSSKDPSAALRFMCLDPRGPVLADNPWDPRFVCRIGPHVLPLAVCPELLVEQQH